MSDAIESLIGTTIEGRLRVQRVLGKGGMGVVLLAHHEECDRPVALKVLSASADNNDKLFAHFVQEARLLARLDHPHIVRAYDFIRGKIDVLVLEYVDGQTLAHLCKGRPMAWPRACQLALQCCAAVSALHAAGFVHRDLNPQNFMVARPRGDAPEQVKLIDLGNAKHLEDGAPLAEGLDRTTTHVPVTPAYMSPEFARGEVRRGDACMDTYGLAVTLYTMLVGRTPWTEGNIHKLFTEVGQDLARVPDDIVIPPALRALLARGLAKKPGDRFATPDALAAAIRGVLPSIAGRRTRPTPRLPVERQPAPDRRARAVLWAGTGVLGAAALATAALLVARLADEAPRLAAGELEVEVLRDEPRVDPRVIVLPERRPEAAPALARPGVDRPAGSVAAQVVRLVPRLRRCKGAPRGPVLLEVDRGLRRIDLEALDGADPWHACARTMLRDVTGRAQVDVYL